MKGAGGRSSRKVGVAGVAKGTLTAILSRLPPIRSTTFFSPKPPSESSESSMTIASSRVPLVRHFPHSQSSRLFFAAFLLLFLRRSSSSVWVMGSSRGRRQAFCYSHQEPC